MKDPKVADMVKELRLYVDSINKLNKKLYKQGVSYRLEDGFSNEINAKHVEIQYLQQKVEY
mgnify:CR=1 FL=1|tara:strand:+ start:131 stop:313 length:183 start_codon:yes stop_codon:yes gene_type:complete